MRKVLIGLQIPAAQKHFDIFVPADLNIRELTELLAKGVVELCDGQYLYSGQEMLARKDPETLLDPEQTLSSYGIRDGAQLVML